MRCRICRQEIPPELVPRPAADGTLDRPRICGSSACFIAACVVHWRGGSLRVRLDGMRTPAAAVEQARQAVA